MPPLLMRQIPLAVMLLSCAAPAVLAQTPAALSAPATMRYDVPAQSLNASLIAIASRGGVRISIDADLARGVSGAAVQGDYTAEQALRRALQGTQLALLKTDSGVYTVQAAAPGAPQAAAQPEATMPEVVVTTNYLGQVTEDTGSYTTGGVSTANRLVLSPRETPHAISVVTRQQMDDFGLVQLSEVLNHTPGVYVQHIDSERTIYYARGFSLDNFSYDGLPWTRDASLNLGESLANMDLYDRVEVLKGANALMSGAGTPGATVNLIRKKPTRELRALADLSAGSWSNYRAMVDVGGPLNDSGSVRARAVASYQDKHSFVDRYQRRSELAYGTVEADLSPRTLLTVGADYQHTVPRNSDWGGAPLFDADGKRFTMPRSFNGAPTWSTQQTEAKSVFASLEHTFDNGWMANLRLIHQANALYAPVAYLDSFPKADGSGTSVTARQYNSDATSNGLDVYAKGPFTLLGRTHELVVGANAYRKQSDDVFSPYSFIKVDNIYTYQGVVPEPKWVLDTAREVIRQKAVYATGRFSLPQGVHVILGGRVSSYVNPTADIDESSVFTPYAGLTWDFAPNLTAFASYSDIFSPQNSRDVNNHTLDPVLGKNLEAGVKGEFLHGRLNASAAVFEVRQDNYAEYVDDVNKVTGMDAYRAIDGVRSRGVELEVAGQLMPGWQLQAGYTHKIARDASGKVNTLAPEDQLSLYSTWQPLPRLTVGGGARWQSRTWQQTRAVPGGMTTVHQGSYAVFDAMARYQISDRLALSFNINNLSDRYYYGISTGRRVSYGDPRNAMLSLNYRY